MMGAIKQIDFYYYKNLKDFEAKPWGFHKTIYETKGFKIKHLIIKPYSCTSLQSHIYRAENWTIIKGNGFITIGDEIKMVCTNDSVQIPINAVHRVENNSNEDLEIIEIQTGNILSENDILRFEDDYGRVNKNLI